MWRVCALVAVVLLAGVTGCGSEDEPQTASKTTSVDSATEERLAALEAEAKAARAEARRERQKAQREREKARRAKAAARRKRAAEREADAEAATPVSSGGGSGGITVPNVVGLDHQAAQNALQGEGLWSLDEKDCSGQDRLLLFDRNWEVVSTSPPAGTAVSEDTTITICSVKQGEN
jgi:pyruvate/2-oxoglutarate dehydrogenase complex dihydrolipoamide acyltransferase (E2) component